MNSKKAVPFVDLSIQHAEIDPPLSSLIESVLDRGDFILGEDVAGFEQEFALYCGVDHAIGVDSGTSALELALRALGLGPGDEVITPANTFIATVLAIIHAGCTPVLVDIDSDTYLMDVEATRAAITPRTAALMPVHLYGQPADMDPLNALADENGLVVIEDASQAHGARYRGRRTGALAEVAAFSLYPAKNLGAVGDAGVVVTSDPGLADSIRLLRNYGSPQKYVHDLLGFNRRLDTIQARVLRAKLPHLDRWNASRRATAELYRRTLADLPVKLPGELDGAEAVYHLFVVEVDDRDGLMAHLGTQGIGALVHYPIPVHLQKACLPLGHGPGDFPLTERAAGRILSLPMYPGMPDQFVERVAYAIRDYVRRGMAVPAS